MRYCILLTLLIMASSANAQAVRHFLATEPPPASTILQFKLVDKIRLQGQPKIGTSLDPTLIQADTRIAELPEQTMTIVESTESYESMSLGRKALRKGRATKKFQFVIERRWRMFNIPVDFKFSTRRKDQGFEFSTPIARIGGKISWRTFHDRRWGATSQIGLMLVR
jgi:hypothetical protein